ncbi:MAG: hypothetical protein P8J20_16080 [Novosphingobium sp.]|nr:hypothetical protein [Novosphingobium sp.]
MTKFVLAYHGGPGSMTPEQGQAHMQAWKAWMDGMGDAVIERGMPVGKSKTVSQSGVADDGGSNPLSGITLIEAETIEAAIELVKPSPHISAGGSIEIAPAMDMEM